MQKMYYYVHNDGVSIIIRGYTMADNEFHAMNIFRDKGFSAGFVMLEADYISDYFYLLN